MASPERLKPYHTGDSMTESQSAREREYIKQTNTLTVLSDLDSSEEYVCNWSVGRDCISPAMHTHKFTCRSAPKLTLAEMDDSDIRDKNQRIVDLENENMDLTARLLEQESQLEQKNLALKQAQQEVWHLLYL